MVNITEVYEYIILNSTTFQTSPKLYILLYISEIPTRLYVYRFLEYYAVNFDTFLQKYTASHLRNNNLNNHPHENVKYCADHMILYYVTRPSLLHEYRTVRTALCVTYTSK
jgi:hypothetical protein